MLENEWRAGIAVDAPELGSAQNARTLKTRFKEGENKADESDDVVETTARKHMRIGDLLWDRGRASAAAKEYEKAGAVPAFKPDTDPEEWGVILDTLRSELKKAPGRWTKIADGIKGEADRVAKAVDAITAKPSRSDYAGAARAVWAAVTSGLGSGVGPAVTKVLNYYAAPGSSISSKEDLFAAANRARMVGW